MVVAVIALSRIASTTQQNQVLSVLLKPVTTEFNWTRSTFIGASAIGTILGGLAAVLVGPLIDRFGPRWVMFIGFFAMGGLMIAMGSIHSLWQFYAILISTRLILQGALNLSNNVVIPKWFINRRGRASALAAMGQRVGAGAMPLVTERLVGGFGWRSAIVSLGLITWVLTLAPTGAFLRRRPEDVGLTPDGDLRSLPTEERPAEQRAEAASERSFTLRQTLRTRAFYILLVVVSLSTFTNAGINFNMYPLLTDRGLSDFHAVAIVSLWSYIGIPTTLMWGALADRFPSRLLLAAVLFGMGAGMALLTQVQDFLLGIVFAIVHGLFFSGSLLLSNLIFANYFGRASFGVIRGFVTPFQMFSNALGPLTATLVFDTRGDYSLIVLAWAVLLPTLGVATLFASPVRRPQESPSP